MQVLKLKISFEENDDVKILPISEGESILDVCIDNDIELQHNCGGVCGCSTCHVYVTKGMEDIQEISEKEEDFIDRAVNPTINSRLACQCIPEKGKEISIVIPNQSDFLGH